MRPLRQSTTVALVNSLTLSRVPAGILAALSFSTEGLKPYLAVFVGFLFASDLLDGALARRCGVATRAGGILDYVVDRFNFYLMICMLIRAGVSTFLFIPFFLRDLLYISVQVYITLPGLRGTKAASFIGTFSVYAYILVINYWGLRGGLLDNALFLALSSSLLNLMLRIFRLRHRILIELKSDTGAC